MGIVICRLLLYPALHNSRFVALGTSFSVPLGIGLSSALFFLTVQVFGMPFSYSATLEVVAVLALLTVTILKGPAGRPGTGRRRVSPSRWLQAAFVLTALSSAISYGFSCRQLPHGSWDAFAIWNLKARFMFRLPHGWEKILTSELGYSHLDYPYLLPDSVTRAWNWVGHDAQFVPAIIGGLFSICTIGVLVFGLREAANGTAALIGGIFLMGTPLFVTLAPTQTADIPLSFYYLATSVSLWLYYRSDTPDSRLLPLIGCTAALAGWTKNEGDPFLLAVLAVVFIFPLNGSPLRERLRRVARVAIGSAPGLIAIILFKVLLAGPNWMAPSLGKSAVIARLTDLSRWDLIFKRIAAGIGQFGGWPVNPVLLVLASFSIDKQISRQRRALYPQLAVLVVVFVAELGVYLIAPREPWLVDSSLDRLLLQLWPTAIFLTLAVWASPSDEIVESRDAGEHSRQQPVHASCDLTERY